RPGGTKFDWSAPGGIHTRAARGSPGTLHLHGRSGTSGARSTRTALPRRLALAADRPLPLRAARRAPLPAAASFAAIALLAAAGATPAAASPLFRVIETDDLRLVYHGPTFQYLAPYTVRCFENSMALERKLFGYRPWEKITLMPNDFSDYGNAGVWTN